MDFLHAIRDAVGFVVAGMLAMGCGAQPGRAEDRSIDLYVTTDAPPAFVDRIRVEILRADGQSALDGYDFNLADPQGQQRGIAGPFLVNPAVDVGFREVLVRIRGFSESRLRREHARAATPGAGALCYGHPELQLGASTYLIPGDAFPNPGWSCAEIAPEALSPVTVNVGFAGVFTVTSSVLDTAIFAIENCGQPGAHVTCGVDQLQVGDPANGGSFVVLVGAPLGGDATDSVTLTSPLDPEQSTPTTSVNPMGQPPFEYPRLEPPSDDVDEQPPPGATIDRLAKLRVGDAAGSLQITLQASCFGVLSDTESQRTCLDGGRMNDVSVTSVNGFSDPVPVPIWSGAEPTGCAATTLEGRACIPGGAFVLGETGHETWDVEQADRAAPERVVAVQPFFLDTHEFKVGDLRNVLGPSVDFSNACDATGSLQARRDDSQPLECVSWSIARALCQARGGDLPTEVQWEYAATTALTLPNAAPGTKADHIEELAQERRFPWKDDAPPANPQSGDEGCTQLHVCGLGTGVAEWVRDSHRPRASDCWLEAPMTNPACLDEREPNRTVKGEPMEPSATRHGEPQSTARKNLGFRCAYPDAPYTYPPIPG